MKFDPLSDRACPVPEYRSGATDNKAFWKPILLLATVIFLIVAPAPDSHDIAEISANFIVAANHSDSSSFMTGESRDYPPRSPHGF
jgi:hypothetical protein